MTVACKSLLGEGPVWVEREQALYWVDIKTPLIWRLGADGGAPRHWTPPMRVSAIAPAASGGMIAATAEGFALIDLEAADYRIIGNPEPGLPHNRFNDGKVDPAGRFWAGTMDDAEEQATGALYRLASDGQWTQIDAGYRVTNGPAFADGVMYHSDSAIRTIYRFPFDDDHELGAREVFRVFGPKDGHPDGMTTDTEGCLWVAFWDGWAVRRFSPEGDELARIDLPVQRPTSCAFGGADLDRLFVTSARIGLDEEALREQPHAGALFGVETQARGLPSPIFAG
ncbi:MAG: SMP-30/gluconolactonase/LRE family protein [Sphingomonadaceae bacterium]|nr:SMP-30/gluconolactonase/LRE family protein [Sphingomonadaceae bacterium]